MTDITKNSMAVCDQKNYIYIFHVNITRLLELNFQSRINLFEGNLCNKKLYDCYKGAEALHPTFDLYD